MIFTETLDRCPVCPSMGTVYRYAENAVRISNMQSPANHAVRQYGITDYTINIVLGAFGGIDHFWGESPPPLSGLYATLPVFADVSHFARTYTG